MDWGILLGIILVLCIFALIIRFTQSSQKVWVKRICFVSKCIFVTVGVLSLSLLAYIVYQQVMEYSQQDELASDYGMILYNPDEK